MDGSQTVIVLYSTGLLLFFFCSILVACSYVCLWLCALGLCQRHETLAQLFLRHHLDKCFCVRNSLWDRSRGENELLKANLAMWGKSYLSLRNFYEEELWWFILSSPLAFTTHPSLVQFPVQPFFRLAAALVTFLDTTWRKWSFLPELSRVHSGVEEILQTHWEVSL